MTSYIDRRETFVSSPEQADEVVSQLRAASVAGLDTEFYGVDIEHESPVGRAICHVWSVAVPLETLHPLGYHEARAWVFSPSLLAYPPLKEWLEDAQFTKAVHNQPVDAHCLHNAGVNLRGGINTLELARWVHPERARGGGGFGLDALGADYLGAGKSESFEDLFGYDAIEPYETTALLKRCECGALSCRYRKEGHVLKWPERVPVLQQRKVKRIRSLSEVFPGDAVWERYLVYAARDAVLALQLYEYLRKYAERNTRPYPWAVAL